MATSDEQQLSEAYLGVLMSLHAIATNTPTDRWHAPTRLAGWSVADIVAHVNDIESILAGRERLVAEPDWSALAHVNGDISRFTERGVEARREWPQPRVVAELGELIEQRRAQLAVLPDDAEVLGPSGKLQPLTRVLGMRCFDLWVHDDDLRDSLALPADTESAACRVTLAKALELVTAKWQAQTPSPGVLTVTITGPQWAQGTHSLGGDGIDVTLECSVSQFLDLVGGRASDMDARWHALVVAP